MTMPAQRKATNANTAMRRRDVVRRFPLDERGWLPMFMWPAGSSLLLWLKRNQELARVASRRGCV